MVEAANDYWFVYWYRGRYVRIARALALCNTNRDFFTRHSVVGRILGPPLGSYRTARRYTANSLLSRARPPYCAFEFSSRAPCRRARLDPGDLLLSAPHRIG